MAYSTKLPEDVDILELLIEIANRFDTISLMNSLEVRQVDEKYVGRYLDEVSRATKSLEKAYETLQAEAKGYNQCFYVKEKNYFGDREQNLKILNTAIGEVKKIYRRSCPRFNKNRPCYYGCENMDQSIFSLSVFSYNHQQLPLFGLEQYPPVVEKLYDQMEKFYKLLAQCLQLCKDVLHDESKMKGDKTYCLYLLQTLKKKLKKEILEGKKGRLTYTLTAAIESRSQYSSDGEWAHVGYHQFNRYEISMLVVKEIIESSQTKGLLPVEDELFAGDVIQAQRFRDIIFRLDEIFLTKTKTKKVSGKLIAFLIMFLNSEGNIKKAYDYILNLYKQSNTNTRTCVNYNAVSVAMGNLKKSESTEYDEFVKKIRSEMFKNTISA